MKYLKSPDTGNNIAEYATFIRVRSQLEHAHRRLPVLTFGIVHCLFIYRSIAIYVEHLP